jgi:glycosyltransferase involved in cell wall biosynthesis
MTRTQVTLPIPAPASTAQSLVIIIPALNEEATIADVVRRVPREIDGISSIEIVVIDDGSTDRTVALAQQAGAEVVSHGANRGVGAAFATGVRLALECRADVVVNMDGDGQFDPADIPKLLEPILFAGADFVSCSRFANPEFMPEMPRIKKWGNAVMTRLINRLAWGSNFTDVSCGFRAYTRDTLLRLNLMADYTYTQETFLNLAAQRIKMAEVPLQILGTRPHGKSRVAGSITKYVLHTVPIIFRTLRDLRPLLFFGGIALAVLAIGLLLGGFVFQHWLDTGHTTPYRSVLTGSAVCIVLAFLLGVLALIADMMKRQRHLLEELLYFSRKGRS